MAEVDAQPVWSGTDNAHQTDDDSEFTDGDMNFSEEDDNDSQCHPQRNGVANSKIPCNEAVNPEIRIGGEEAQLRDKHAKRPSIGNCQNMIINGNSSSAGVNDEIISIVGILGQDHDKVRELKSDFACTIVYNAIVNVCLSVCTF